MARPGLYVRELGVWIVFVVFKGNDLHSGFSPMEDLEAHKQWVDSIVSPMWDHAGPENRIGFVVYPNSAAIQRSASMNFTPSQLFGNFGAAQPHKTLQHTFAKHGQVTLGNREEWANRSGREAVSLFQNFLSQNNLQLNLDINDLIQSISFENQAGAPVALKPLPYHPVEDAAKIALWKGYYQHHFNQSLSMLIRIEKSTYRSLRSTMQYARSIAAVQSVYHPAERRSLTTAITSSPSNIVIEKVLHRISKGGKVIVGYNITERRGI